MFNLKSEGTGPTSLLFNVLTDFTKVEFNEIWWLLSFLFLLLWLIIALSSGTVKSNMVNLKFHLIQSFCEMFFYHFIFLLGSEQNLADEWLRINRAWPAK